MATTVSMTNIVANGGKGWFPGRRGNCTWLNSSMTPGDGATSSVKITPSGAGECTLTSSTAHNLVASHKYYISFKVYFASDTQGTCDWYWPVAEPCASPNMSFNAPAKTWVRLSSVFDRTSFSDGSYPCRFDYNNNNGKNTPFWFTSCMLIDLTAAFGAGLEPSKDWMDKHVAAFADSQKVQYIENLGELFVDIANAIRTKSGQSGKIMACDFADRIRAL